MKPFIFLTILTLLSCKGMTQVKQTMLDEVLKSKDKNKEHIFKKTESYGEVNISVNYLGSIATKSNNYEVITYTVYFKEDNKYTSAILFFNNSNHFLGKYIFVNVSKIIAKIKEQKIIFDNAESYCDSSIKNELDLSNGLPKIFKTKCDDRTEDGHILEDGY